MHCINRSSSVIIAPLAHNHAQECASTHTQKSNGQSMKLRDYDVNSISDAKSAHTHIAAIAYTRHIQ